MHQLGRPPAERGVKSFVGTLIPPDELVLDTSFIVEALIPTQPRHADCSAFLQNIALAGSRVIVNRLVEAELWEAAYQIALRERHGPSAKKMRFDRRTLGRAERLRVEVDQAWIEVLTTLDWLMLEYVEVKPHVAPMMAYGLSAFDAIHAATAVFADVRAFVTLDYHFASVPESRLELWVTPHRVAPCRKRRGGRSR